MNESGEVPSLLALWAKSDAEGHPHSLPGHLLDAAAVGELIWDRFMAQITKTQLDRACLGHGRDVFRLVCGWHDLGKATPTFQLKMRDLATRAEGSGWTMPFRPRLDLKHGASGSVIASRVLGNAGVCGLAWVPPLIEGHHGAFRSVDGRAYRDAGQGSSELWQSGQDRLALWVAGQLGVRMTDLAKLPNAMPPLGLQLATAGLLSMADWIASSSLFVGLDCDAVSIDQARERADRAWSILSLRGGWSLGSTVGAADFERRFGWAPRPLQATVLDAADRMTQPGLMIIEAPMGEGKTEAALSAIESLGANFNCSGFAFAMPTQGTTDSMFKRCWEWAGSVDASLPVALVHGKAMANEQWHELLAAARINDVDDPDCADPYGLAAEVCPDSSRVPAEWLLGRHRALLSPGVVATVDHLLIAASLGKYIALRHAGLAGKVLVIDEVHSYDVFMAQYLHQLLAWCSDAQIPVVLMSATLPPRIRQELLDAYASGLAPEASAPGDVVEVSGYPLVTTWTGADGVHTVSTGAWKADSPVTVSILPVEDVDEVGPIADVVDGETQAGGCALVILNTVARAQAVYRLLRDRKVPAVLLHGRLTTSERATRTAQLVECLGAVSDSPDTAARTPRRPERLVVVATQVAEQSFDIDTDLLVTDLAPMDLLLQRVGRLHRHIRPAADRPTHLRLARVIVTGTRLRGAQPPDFVRAFGYVYDRYSLLCSALLIEKAGAVWNLPSQIPALVAAAYGDDLPWPPGWSVPAEQARTELRTSEQDRIVAAQVGTLRRQVSGLSEGTLEGLHDGGAARLGDRIPVRDGEPSREVVLVRRLDDCYVSLRGRALGPNGERCTNADLAIEVLGDSVRVREREDLGEVRPLPGWDGVHLLRSMPALVLDADNRATGPWGTASYDPELGLIIERTRSAR